MSTIRNAKTYRGNDVAESRSGTHGYVQRDEHGAEAQGWRVVDAGGPRQNGSEHDAPEPGEEGSFGGGNPVLADECEHPSLGMLVGCSRVLYVFHRYLR